MATATPQFAWTLFASAALAGLVLETLFWLVTTVTAALFLACVSHALSHCCRGTPNWRTRGALILAAALVPVSTGDLGAQSAGSPDSIPELRPRFEKVFGSDSMQVDQELRQGSTGIGVTPSPDGRWLLFSSEWQRGSGLWLAPAAGGEPVHLTDGQDGQWSPSGDAIFFRGQSAIADPIMRLPIDLSTGEALGPPRQVTLEPAMGGFAVSPEGERIAYATGEVPYAMSLRVLPARGGSAETVVDVSGLIIGARWGPNGDSLYYVHWANVQVPEAAIMRVPVEGGEPQRVSVWDDWISLGPRAQYIYRRIPSAETEQNLYEVTAVDGRPLARFGLPGPFALSGFGGRPDEVYAVRQDAVSPLRVVTLAGGPVRRLNEAWSYDVPLDWSPDGREVLFTTRLNGEQVLMFAPLDGGPMRQLPIPENHLAGTRHRFSRDGRQLLYLSAGQKEGEHGFWIYDIARDTAIQVDEGMIPPGTAGGQWEIKGSGPGNGSLYGLTRDGHHELKEAQPDGSARVLWRFKDTGEEPPKVRVRGDLIVFTRNDGETGSLFVARAGTERERRLLTLPGDIGPRGSRPPTWSPDGRLLAASYFPPGDGRSRELLMVDVTEAGELTGEPRRLSIDGGPTWWWDDLAWLPDGRHFLVIGGRGDGPNVWLVSLDPDTPPVEVTSEVEGSVWSYTLSPDGRHIAIESEIPRGSSIWRVELGEIPGGR